MGSVVGGNVAILARSQLLLLFPHSLAHVVDGADPVSERAAEVL